MSENNVLEPWQWSGKQVEAPLRLRKPRFIQVPDLWNGEWTDEMRDRMFAVMARTPKLTYQILTKRPGRAAEYLQNAERRVVEMVADDYGMDSQWIEARLKNVPWPTKNVQMPEAPHAE